MDLTSALRAVRRRWTRVVVSLVVFLLIGVATSVLLPRQFASTARLVVKDTGSSATNQPLLQTQTASYIQLLKSDGLARLVISDLDLSVSPKTLLRRVSVELEPGTSVIDVTARDRRSSVAQTVAESAASNAVLYLGAIAQGEDGRASSFATDEERQRATSSSPVTVAQGATAAARASFPKLSFIIGLAVVAGLFVGVAWALLADRGRRTVSGPQDVAEIDESITVLGVVPSDLDADSVVAGSDTLDGARRIASLLRRLTREGSSARVVFTTPTETSVGVVTTQIASALSEAGQSTVLVDADLRTARLSALLGHEHSSGLADAVLSRADEVTVHPLAVQLSFVAAGKLDGDAGAVVVSRRTHELLTDAAPRSSLTLLAAPPLDASSDAGILAQDADLLVIVATTNQTRHSEIRDALSTARAAGATSPTILLTVAPRPLAEEGGSPGRRRRATAE